jgi:uncharacterized protein (DUF2126 family)
MCILQKTWQEIVDNTSALYEEALCRLGTDKFMVDGRRELVAETT